MVHSNWIARDIVSNSPTAFLYKESGRDDWRKINQQYPSSWQTKCKRSHAVEYPDHNTIVRDQRNFELADFDNYVFGPERDDFVLANDKIVVGSPRIGRNRNNSIQWRRRGRFFEMMPQIFPDALDRIVQLRPDLVIWNQLKRCGRSI